MRMLCLLAALVLMGAAQAQKAHLRYHPAPETRWATSGTISVSTWIGWPDGAESTLEVSDLSWTDVVRETRGPMIVLTRSIERWTRRDTGQNLASSEPVAVSVTELLGLAEKDFLDQPDLYPEKDVMMGESWLIVHPPSVEVLPLGERALLLVNTTRGTGRLTRLEPDMLELEVDTTTVSVGRGKDLASQSLIRTHWRLLVERGEGVPLEQNVRIRTTQTLTMGRVTVPSRLEVTIRLKTHRVTE